MEQAALFWDHTVIFWSPLILVLAVGAGVCLFWAFYIRSGGGVAQAAAVAPLALLLSVPLARLVHWYCRSDSYSGLAQAMTDYSGGGFALIGAFLGCFLAAALLKAIGAVPRFLRLLDCMSLSGCAAIALGRLSCLFNASDRGPVLPWGAPLVWPICDPVSGAQEPRFATFLVQSMAAGCIFLGLTLLQRRGKPRDGDLCQLFLLTYGASQVVLDSTRYDALYLRSNGFVSLVQIGNALAVVAVCILFSVRLVCARGRQPWQLLLWGGMALLLGRAGYMEYYVQRHADQAGYAYAVMAVCMASVAALGVLAWYLAWRRERMPTIYPVKGDTQL